ncbi:MAG: glycosidase [Clostridia bacterium]|nr:glycosidase [Clostridia bacterium]
MLVPHNELEAKFNSGAYYKDGVVHLLYRRGELSRPSGGASPDYVKNYIAHAVMTPEGRLLFDDPRPALARTTALESRGMEDPRIFTLDGEIYITYTAWDGRQARVAFARTNDDFTVFEKIGVVPARRFDKDAFLFPERIGGKIAYVHRFEPNIQIDYFDDLDDLFDENFWAHYTPDENGSVALTGEQPWEEGKLGGSLPPIRTPDGWLFVYHGVAHDRWPFCYRAGIALLDSDDPHRILSRLPYPVLEPTENYETTGDVNNVVFPCGGYIYNGDLYLVYGGADKVTALARCPLEDVLKELKVYARADG